MRLKTGNGNAIANAHQTQEMRIEHEVRLDQYEWFSNVLTGPPEGVYVVGCRVLTTIDEVNREPGSGQLQIIANLLVMVTDNHDQTIEALGEQARNKPPENGDTAHFRETLGGMVRQRLQARPRTRGQQKSRSNETITGIAWIPPRRQL